MIKQMENKYSLKFELRGLHLRINHLSALFFSFFSTRCKCKTYFSILIMCVQFNFAFCINVIIIIVNKNSSYGYHCVIYKNYNAKHYYGCCAWELCAW